jgi:hypothetical protein
MNFPAKRFLVFLLLGAVFQVGALGLPAQDRVLLEAEKIRAELHDLQQTMLLGGGGADPFQKSSQLQTRLDSVFAAQERLLPATQYQRRPSVKAPEGARDLLQHERHAIVDFFFGPQMLHAFVITRKETHYRVIPLPTDIRARISAFQCQISMPGADPAAYQDQAVTLYQIFLEPLEDLLSEIDQLTIIPDRHIRFLPMGALVREEMQAPDFRKMHYLLRDFGIGYALSVARLAEIHEMSDPGGKGMALFSQDKNVDKEPSIARRHWTAKPETGAYRIDSDLRKEGPKSEIVHLSCAFDQAIVPAEIAHFDLDLSLGVVTGIRSRICVVPLSPMPIGDQWLMALELAGARSIVLPAWQVEETAIESGVEEVIWDEFYRALADRQYVDQALRSAKLKYLKNAPTDRIHPFYWAGLMQFNDFGPVREQAHFPWYIFLAGGFLLIVFLGKKL